MLAARYVFNVSELYVAKDGNYKSIKTINGLSPGPTIQASENEWISVTVHNHLEVGVSFHFHGLLQHGTPWADGVPGITQYPISSGETYRYRFQARNQSGALWYHAHYRGYSSDGLYGLMYIVPRKSRLRPYRLVTSNPGHLHQLMELEKHPAYLIADDVFKQSMDNVLQRMFQHNIDPLCIQSILVNGKGRVQCHNPSVFHRLAGKNPSLAEIPRFDSMGCSRDAGLNGTDMDNIALEVPGYLAPCRATQSPLHIHYTNGRRWQYIHLLNAGGQYTKAFSVDDHPFYVIAVDGIFVVPQKVHSMLLPVGSRATVLIETRAASHDTARPFKIRFLAVYTTQYIEGHALLFYGEPSALSAASSMDHGTRYQDLDGHLMQDSYRSIWPHQTLPLEESHQLKTLHRADVTYVFYLHRFSSVQFTMFKNRTQLPRDFETRPPLLDSQDLTCASILHPPIHSGQVVDLIINNHRHINHPIHLHGHYVHVVSFSGHENFPYASMQEAVEHKYHGVRDNFLYCDVILVPVGGHAVLRFTADNPGIWLLHCHNIGHLMGGMGAILLESPESIPKRHLSM